LCLGKLGLAGRREVRKLQKEAESELIARAVVGDGGAFAQLIGPFEAKVYSLAYRISGNRDDAADLAQEAFLKVFRALGRFKGDSSFSTWLYRVVSNACLDQLRRRRRSVPVVSMDDPIDTDTGGLRRDVGDVTYEPEELALRAEVQAEIRAAVAGLPLDHRMAIVLRDFEGFSYEEIARVLGCNLGTVKSRISRARSTLRDRLRSRELLAHAGVYSVDSARPGSPPPGGRPGLGRPEAVSSGPGAGQAKGVDA